MHRLSHRTAACSALRAAQQRLRRGNASAALADGIERAVTADAAAALTQHGFVVIDGVFGARLADALRAEVVALKQAGCMRVNATHLVARGATERLEKRGIYEAEAHALGAHAAVAPQLSALSRDRTLLTLLTTYLETSRADALHYQSLKLQYNEGGAACFPLHYDTDLTLDTRRITALFYLNPSWRASHGGELVLYPLPHKRVVIPPLHDRLVLFSAPSMLHRVLPSAAAERVCFTLWAFARDEARKKPSGTVEFVPGPATLAKLLEPSVAKHTAKAVYQDEWLASLLQAHPDTAARAAAVQTFTAEVQLIESVLEQRFPGARALIAELRSKHAQRVV
jgi:hypothetical protein